MSHDIKDIWIRAEKYKEKCLEAKQLQGRLAAAEEALSFYEDCFSWLREADSDVARRVSSKDLSAVPGYAEFCGGRVARAYFEKYGEHGDKP